MGELLCSIEQDRTPTIDARRNLESLALCFAAVASADTHAAGRPGYRASAAGVTGDHHELGAAYGRHD